MAERHRSQDGEQETEQFTDDLETPGHQGRFGGELQRQVGTKAALKRVEKGEDAITRVRKSDETEKDGSDD